MKKSINLVKSGIYALFIVIPFLLLLKITVFGKWEIGLSFYSLYLLKCFVIFFIAAFLLLHILWQEKISNVFEIKFLFGIHAAIFFFANAFVNAKYLNLKNISEFTTTIDASFYFCFVTIGPIMYLVVDSFSEQ